jgi:hypothetical protein
MVPTPPIAEEEGTDGRMSTSAELIRRSARLLLSPGQVVELRALHVQAGNRRGTLSGYFDSIEPLVRAAAEADGHDASGVYITANPTDGRLLSRRSNHAELIGKDEPSTSDRDISTRRHLYVDCDPRRPAGISSSDSEHAAALEKARAIDSWLQAAGWPAAALADSGNGAHLLYRIDLPNDKASELLVKRVLCALEARFGDEAVGIDQSVYNAARIVKLWGTTARKGDNTPERPHRVSRLLTVPEPLEEVPREQLERLAESAPEDMVRGPSGNGGSIDVDGYLEAHNIDVSKRATWNTGKRWELQSCPWDESHKRGAFVIQFQSGAVAAGCLHSSCREKKWHDLRDTVEGPEWRNGKTRQQAPHDQWGPGDAWGRQEHPSSGQPANDNQETGVEARLASKIRNAWHCFTPEELLEDPPPQSFIWKPRIPAGQVVVLSGPGGSNKTTLITAVAVYRALGQPFLDGTTPAPGQTVILSTEDRLEDYRRKLAALRVEMGASFDPKRVAEQVHFVDLGGEPIRMVEAEYGQYKPTALPDALATVIRERAPDADLIVLETVSRLAGGAETNESLSILVEAAQRLCKLIGAAVVLVHHVSQDAGRRGVADQYAGRGGSALGDNARSSMVLTRLTRENLKQYAPNAKLADSELERLLVFTQPKSNGAQAAPPLILERHGNEHGPVLQLANLATQRAESEAEKIERLRDLVERLTLRGIIVTERKLRGYTADLGVGEKAIGRLVTEAEATGAISRRSRPGRGGGEQLIANPKPERTVGGA